MAQSQLGLHRSRGAVCSRKSTTVVRSAVQVATSTKVAIKEYGSYSVKGTVRKVNEDRFDVKIADETPDKGEPFAFAGVYDGHGGFATADWLQNRLFSYIQQHWTQGFNPSESMVEAFIKADAKILEAKSGFLGLGERGVGGSKCGATAATAMLYQDEDGSTKLVTANCGDARIVLIRGGKAQQLSEDHVPDSEKERARIEKTNPNPRMPLVRYVGGTWRVGGLLALSRAFGNAYLKGSMQFEGVNAGGDNYSSGFGVISEPYTTVQSLTEADSWLIVSSDGLYAEEERGGGGGLDNQQLAELLAAAGSAPCNKIAETLATTAVAMGSTDDVTVVVMKLGSA